MKHIVDTTELESGWMVLKGHDPNRRMAKGTLVIGDERVFTEREVRAMLRDLIEDQARCDVHNGWQSGMIPDFAGIATKHGVSLDPA